MDDSLGSGDLVGFTVSLYEDIGLGMVICEKPIYDRNGTLHTSFYCVLTHTGVKVISDAFMKRLR